MRKQRPPRRRFPGAPTSRVARLPLLTSAGGTTPSGLPRRVPKQNLVPGNAKAAPQDGPQVSRDPNEVRGRLTNLRRGVEQGRSAGGDPGATGSFRIDPDQISGNGQHNSSTDLFGGSNHQER